MLIFSREDKGRKKERERSINAREKHPLVASDLCPDLDPTRNLGMCPNQESNPQSAGLRYDTLPTEPHQPGPLIDF